MESHLLKIAKGGAPDCILDFLIYCFEKINEQIQPTQSATENLYHAACRTRLHLKGGDYVH